SGDVLVVGPASGSVRRWAPRSLLRPVDGWPTARLPRVWRVAASLEGDEWAMLTENGTLIRIDQKGRMRGEPRVPGEATPTTIASLSQRRLLVQSSDGCLHLYEAGREPETVFVPRHRHGSLWSGHDWPLAVTPNGDVAAFCDPAGRVALYQPT